MEVWAINGSEEDGYYLIHCVLAIAVTKIQHYWPALLIQREHTNPNQKDSNSSNNFSMKRLKRLKIKVQGSPQAFKSYGATNTVGSYRQWKHARLPKIMPAFKPQ